MGTAGTNATSWAARLAGFGYTLAVNSCGIACDACSMPASLRGISA